MIESYGPDTIAAFIAEPVAGATLAAAVPCEDYWPKIVEVCRRYGVLVIADEVMTGFGRTGRWFGVDHWDVRPDIVTAGKGTTSGYVPFGFAACTRRDVRGGRTEGVRARVHLVAQRARRRGRAGDARAAARRRTSSTASEKLGADASDELATALGGRRRRSGDVRGLGMMIGIELVADRDTKEPFPRHRTGDRAGGRGGARGRAAPLLLDRARRRRRRRPADARPAVRPDRRGRRRRWSSGRSAAIRAVS